MAAISTRSCGSQLCMMAGLASWALFFFTAPQMVSSQANPVAWPSPITASQVTGSTGFRINGIDTGDMCGNDMATGDFNGDRLTDVAIAASKAGGARGELYVLFGKPQGQSISSPLQLSPSYFDGANGFVVYGVDSGDNLGSQLSSGDFNNDGVDDLLITARTAKGSSNSGVNVGEVYVLFGKPQGQPFDSIIQLSALYFNGVNGLVIYALEDQDLVALLPSRRGDVNSDGVHDILLGCSGVGAAGAVFVLFGKPQGQNFTSPIYLSPSYFNGTTGFILYGITNGDGAGTDVDFADFNGDQISDILIVAPGAGSTSNPVTHTGEVYVVFGKSQSIFLGGELSSYLDGINGLIIRGFVNGYISQVTAGDFNGDQADDILCGNSGVSNSLGELNSGSGFVVFGKSQGPFVNPISAADLNGQNGFVIWGINEGDRAGTVGSGDFNGDGVDDILLGSGRAAGSENNGVNVGEVYLLLGKSQGKSFEAEIQLSPSYFNGLNGFIFYGADDQDWTGWSLRSGDLNQDGIDDVLIGAPLYNVFSTARSGSVYVVYGQQSGCVPGYFFNDTLSTCVACPVGTFQDSVSLSLCSVCSNTKPALAEYSRAANSSQCPWECLPGVRSFLYRGEQHCSKLVPLENMFTGGSETELWSSSLVFAALTSSLKPAMGALLDSMLLEHGYVVPGGKGDDQRCFDSLDSVGKEVCYNVSIVGHCNILEG